MNYMTIGEIARVVSKGTTPSSVGLSFSTEGIAFLKGEDVQGGAIDFSIASTFINSDSHRILKRSALEYGDVLITIAGTIGRIGFISERGRVANCNQAVAFVRPDLKKIDSEWLCYFLQSPRNQSKLSDFVAGGAIPNVNLQQIRSIEVPSIDINNQRRMAARMKSQLTEVGKARKAALTQLGQIDLLTSRILAQEFHELEA